MPSDDTWSLPPKLAGLAAAYSDQRERDMLDLVERMRREFHTEYPFQGFIVRADVIEKLAGPMVKMPPVGPPMPPSYFMGTPLAKCGAYYVSEGHPLYELALAATKHPEVEQAFAAAIDKVVEAGRVATR